MWTDVAQLALLLPAALAGFAVGRRSTHEDRVQHPAGTGPAPVQHSEYRAVFRSETGGYAAVEHIQHADTRSHPAALPLRAPGPLVQTLDNPALHTGKR